jgi:hypothetical protein
VNGRIPNEVGEKINARPADVQGEDLHQVYLGEKTEDLVSASLGLPSRGQLSGAVFVGLDLDLDANS